MAELHFTHKGWFGICPVYLHDPYGQSPVVDPRHPLLTPLMVFSEVLFGLVFWVMSSRDPNFEPQWPIRITGRLDPPIAFEPSGAED